MSYLELLSLTREPFSNSPDPEVFYGAETHALCLNRLEIAIRLKRGMNVVLGQVGTGKSTLCRRLLRHLRESESLKVYCLLDAGGTTAEAFLVELCALFDCDWDGRDVQEGIGRLQSTVYDWNLVKGVSPVLLIDEGQKLTPEQMEILRVLLNFETNTEKLLQIVIFAQPEFQAKMDAMPNFRDRVNECLTLETLTDEEGAAMLMHRLRTAGGERAVGLFTPGALKLICRAGEGRPRQLIRLAHLSLLAMIMTNRSQVDAKLVRTQVLKKSPVPGWVKGVATVSILAILGAGGWWLSRDGVPTGESKRVETPVQAVPAAEAKPTVDEPKAEPLRAEEPALPAAATSPDVRRDAAVVSPSAPTSAEPVSSLPTPPVLGEVNLGEHLPVGMLADLFYGTQTAVDPILALNPDYELLKSTSVVLPELHFDVPAKLRENHQLAYGEFETLDAAYRAMLKWEALEPRFVVRKGADGVRRYYVMARASFSVPERAWVWFSNRKPPRDVRPQLLPPFGTDDKAYCEFH